MSSSKAIRAGQRALWAGLAAVSAYRVDGLAKVPGVARRIVGTK